MTSREVGTQIMLSLDDNLNTFREAFSESYRECLTCKGRTLVDRLKIKPPQFTGRKNENIKHFFSSFEKFIVGQEISKTDYLQALGLMLSNEPIEFYDNIMKREGEANS